MTSVSTDRRLGVNSGAAVKVPCRVASTANLTLSGEQTIDGIACVTGDRVLVKNQTSAVNNGIYIVDTGTWGRAPDWDGAYDVVTGTLVLVNSGTTNAHTGWQVTTTGTITVDTTSVSFTNAFLSDSASVSFVPPGTGAATTTLQARGRLVVYSTDYGSKMTTTPAADINAAITYVNGQGGGTVIVPAGSYTAETTILQKSNVTLDLRGVTLTAITGLNAPIIKNATAVTTVSVSGITNAARVATVTTAAAHGLSAGDYVHISGATPEAYNGWHKVITVPLTTTFTYYVDKNIAADSGTISIFKSTDSNLKILGGKLVGNALNTVGDNYGLEYEGVKEFELDSLTSDGTYHSGIVILAAVNGKMYRVRGDNVIHGSHNGILLGASSTLRYADDIEMVACQASANGQDGILLERGKGIRLIACGGQYNGLCAIKIGKPSDVSAVGCWGKYNTGGGIQVQPFGGNRNILIASGDFCENGEAGIQVGNTDTAAPFVNISLIGNKCHRNGQTAGTAIPYGIAFEGTVAATIDRVLIQGNQCDEQSRGISFGASGTVSNVTMVGNRAKGNAADANFGASLDLTTFQYGFNEFANGANGLVLRALATSGISPGNTANADANTLDWYAEGTWTPVLTFATPGDQNIVYAGSGQIGRYTRIGDTVFLFCHINTSTFTHTTSAGNLQITGCPFTSVNVAGLTQISSGMGW